MQLEAGHQEALNRHAEQAGSTAAEHVQEAAASQPIVSSSQRSSKAPALPCIPEDCEPDLVLEEQIQEGARQSQAALPAQAEEPEQAQGALLAQATQPVASREPEQAQAAAPVSTLQQVPDQEQAALPPQASAPAWLQNSEQARHLVFGSSAFR